MFHSVCSVRAPKAARQRGTRKDFEKEKKKWRYGKQVGVGVKE